MLDSKPRRLNANDLLNHYSKLQAVDDIRREPGLGSLFVWIGIARFFLGDEWAKKNIHPLTGNGFLGLKRETASEVGLQKARISDLAELLFNLQHVEGFDDLTSRMRTTEPEASLADLQVGRTLYINDIQFRFINPQGKLGDDYDLEVIYPDGIIACAETKCRLSSVGLGKNTIRNALRNARSQLPPDKPGIIFIKFPQQWFENGRREATQQKMIEDVRSFFGTADSEPRNQRIVSVKFYCEPLSYQSGVVEQSLERLEISHHRNKFFPGRDWDLLDYRPSGRDIMPFKWVRLINFPAELEQHKGA